MCAHFHKICIWTRQDHSRLIEETSNILVALLHLTKTTVKSRFWDFFNSKTPFGGYFQAIVCTNFQKIYIWTRQEHSRSIWETSNFLIALFRFVFKKTTWKSKFSDFFNLFFTFNTLWWLLPREPMHSLPEKMYLNQARAFQI